MCKAIFLFLIVGLLFRNGVPKYYHKAFEDSWEMRNAASHEGCRFPTEAEKLIWATCPVRGGSFPLPKECTLFVKCFKNQKNPEFICCPEDFHFDHVLRRCVNMKEARCKNVCPRRGIKYPHASNPMRYFMCTAKGVPEQYTCPEGYHYNPGNFKCSGAPSMAENMPDSPNINISTRAKETSVAPLSHAISPEHDQHIIYAVHLPSSEESNMDQSKNRGTISPLRRNRKRSGAFQNSDEFLASNRVPVLTTRNALHYLHLKSRRTRPTTISPSLLFDAFMNDKSDHATSLNVKIVNHDYLLSTNTTTKKSNLRNSSVAPPRPKHTSRKSSNGEVDFYPNFDEESKLQSGEISQELGKTQSQATARKKEPRLKYGHSKTNKFHHRQQFHR